MEHNQQKKKSKQNITRDIEVKNNLTMVSGEGTVRRGDYRNYYKGHMDKIKGEGLSLIHISEPTRQYATSRMPSSA